MEETDTIYIVVSLPRTGTTTLCKMADDVGLKSVHSSTEDFPDLVSRGFNFFADTPFFDPGYLICLFQHHKNIKVIYSEKSMVDIEKSYLKTNLINYYLDVNLADDTISQVTGHELLIATIWQRLHIKKLRDQHRLTVKGLCMKYNIEFLSYNLKDGWEPFCKFVDKPVPSIEVPRLNADLRGTIIKL